MNNKQIDRAYNRLIEAGFDKRDISILENEKPDAFNISESTGNDFCAYYLDDRGNRENEIRLPLLSLCVDYLINLRIESF